MSRIDVALSGGVDSAVAAALLVEEGHQVTGVTIDLGLRESESTVADARIVAEHLGVALRVVDLSGVFESEVLSAYADDYADGITPNPCVHCNEIVKCGALLSDVLGSGAEALATGHFARIGHELGRARLLRAADREKDQSYFLYRIASKTLDRLRFPVGGLQKRVVRSIAERMGLPMHDRPESQEACFAQAVPHTEIVALRRPDGSEAGDILDLQGNIVGTHDGVAGFTVGQRRGLGGGSSEPRYVVSVDATRRAVVVGAREDAETDQVVAEDVVWLDERLKGHCSFRFRHGQEESEGKFAVNGGRLTVSSDEPMFGVSPGQALVCYAGEMVLGGGTIARTHEEGT